jgi:periplasmic copper chaperone A
MRVGTSISIGLASICLAWSAAVHAEVTVTGPWVRGMVSGQSETGVFMTIKSTDAVKLVSASSPVAQRAEVHKMTMDQGMMKMRPMDALDIPAHGEVQLKPGGFHLMLLGVAKPLGQGDKVPVTLVFEDKQGKKTSTTVQADVRPLGGAMSDMHDMPMKKN